MRCVRGVDVVDGVDGVTMELNSPEVFTVVTVSRTFTPTNLSQPLPLSPSLSLSLSLSLSPSPSLSGVHRPGHTGARESDPGA